MSGETTILCEGLLKGNVDLEEHHQQALRKALLERENRLLFPQSFVKNALAVAVTQFVNSQVEPSPPNLDTTMSDHIVFANMVSEYLRVRTLAWVLEKYPMERIDQDSQFAPEAKIYVVTQVNGKPSTYAAYLERPSGMAEPAGHELPILLQIYPIIITEAEVFLRMAMSPSTSPLSLGGQRLTINQLGDLSPWIASLQQEIDHWTIIAAEDISQPLTSTRVSRLLDALRRHESFGNRTFGDFMLTNTVDLVAEVFGRYYDDRLLDPKKTDVNSLRKRQCHLQQLRSVLSQMKKELP